MKTLYYEKLKDKVLLELPQGNDPLDIANFNGFGRNIIEFFDSKACEVEIGKTEKRIIPITIRPINSFSSRYNLRLFPSTPTEKIFNEVTNTLTEYFKGTYILKEKESLVKANAIKSH